MFPRVITIDGPAGAGKSTLGERLAQRLGYTFFDTGLMYRLVAWLAVCRAVDPGDEAALVALAEQTQIEVVPPTVDDGRQATVLADGEDITHALRRPEVDRTVSQVASYRGVRRALIAQQRHIAARGKVVMVGRDIGTVVVPDAALKLYLDASIDERARRRTRELQAQGRQVNQDDICAQLARRDDLDSHVMQPAPDAVVLRNDTLSLDDEVDHILHLIESRFSGELSDLAEPDSEHNQQRVNNQGS